jgi:hypothetical protein
MAHKDAICFDHAPGLRSGCALNPKRTEFVPTRHAQEPAADAAPKVRRLTPEEAREVLASLPTFASTIKGYGRLGGPAR